MNLKPIGLLAENEKGEIIFIKIREEPNITYISDTPTSDGSIDNPGNLAEGSIVETPTPKDLKFEEDKEEAKEKTLDNILEKHKEKP